MSNQTIEVLARVLLAIIVILAFIGFLDIVDNVIK